MVTEESVADRPLTEKSLPDRPLTEVSLSDPPLTEVSVADCRPRFSCLGRCLRISVAFLLTLTMISLAIYAAFASSEMTEYGSCPSEFDIVNAGHCAKRWSLSLKGPLVQCDAISRFNVPKPRKKDKRLSKQDQKTVRPQTLSLQNVQGCNQFHEAVNKVNTSECSGLSWKRSED